MNITRCLIFSALMRYQRVKSETLDTALFSQIFGHQNISSIPHLHSGESEEGELKGCSLRVFVESVINTCFGMGNDYAITDKAGTPLKSYFTVKEAMQAAKLRGYYLSSHDTEKYLDYLVEKGYFEKREGEKVEYRRRVFLFLMKSL